MTPVSNFITDTTTNLSLFLAHLPVALLIVAGLWVIQIINASLHYRLNVLGIYPRHPIGLIGIIFAPFLHGNFSHLFLNSIPLVILIDFLLITGIHTFIYVTIIIIVLSGLATWLFARKAIHIGASSVVMGYWGYLLINAYEHPSNTSIILAILCIFYFGSMWLNLFPTGKKTSWEGHVFGFLAGLIAALIY